MRPRIKIRREGPSLASVVIPSLRRAGHYAADKAIDAAKVRTRTTIRGVGLGGLANAVGATSSLKKRRTQINTAWGAIYARGGEFSRANQALMAYTEGARILPTGGRKWLAYPTKAAGRLVRLPIPRTRGRGYANFKNQPSRGPQLQFVQFSPRRAALVLKDASVNPKTGRANKMGTRLGRGQQREKMVIMFWLIKFTSRAARFNQHRIVAQEGARMGTWMAEAQAREAR